MQADHGAIDDQKLNLHSHKDLNETEYQKLVMESLTGPAAMRPIAANRDGLTLPLDSIQANTYLPNSLNGQFEKKQNKDLNSNIDFHESEYHTRVCESLSGLQVVQKVAADQQDLSLHSDPDATEYNKCLYESLSGPKATHNSAAVQQDSQMSYYSEYCKCTNRSFLGLQAIQPHATCEDGSMLNLHSNPDDIKCHKCLNDPLSGQPVVAHEDITLSPSSQEGLRESGGENAMQLTASKEDGSKLSLHSGPDEDKSAEIPTEVRKFDRLCWRTKGLKKREQKDDKTSQTSNMSSGTNVMNKNFTEYDKGQQASAEPQTRLKSNSKEKSANAKLQTPNDKPTSQPQFLPNKPKSMQVTLIRSSTETFGLKFIHGTSEGRARWENDNEYYVTEVTDGGIASKASRIRKNDTIESVNEIKVSTLDHDDVEDLFCSRLKVKLTLRRYKTNIGQASDGSIHV